MTRRTIISMAAWLCMAALITSCGKATDSTEPTSGDELYTALQLSTHPNPYDRHTGGMPDGGRKMKINSIGGTLGKVFNDLPDKHLEAAAAIGIDPINNYSDALHTKRPVVRIASCADFYVDKLTHSVPYLVPEAAQLLHDIGSAFADSLASRGGGRYRIKVTSVLRTPQHISKLKKRNVNSVENSAHLYGTTFDISYAKFICDSEALPRTQEDLKNLLAEVLNDLRTQGRCYIKYERKQGCFHITARN